MQEQSVSQYAENPMNIWGKKVTPTTVYTAIESGRLKTKKVGSATIIIDQIVQGVIQHRVLILPDKPKDDGFVKAEHTIPIPDTGEIIHVGPGKVGGDPMVLVPGMRVQFNNNKISTKLTYDGVDYFVLFQDDVHLIL